MLKLTPEQIATTERVLKLVEGSAPPEKAPIKNELTSKPASSYTMRAISWFWPGRFAIGKLAIIGGCRTRARG
jgi:hypothetical protein